MRKSPSPAKHTTVRFGDFTGSQILLQAIGDLRRRNIEVAVARLEAERAQQAAARTGLIDALGADHVFLSVDEAIRTCTRRLTRDAEQAH